uniref:Uncharacterized protein n=2 Tax=unclassified Arthrobacter TaxID=235627 RepID=I3W1R6_9MICC|nr:hypothetical protein [Arthrobacter sp. J3.37]AFK89543.1 hypothetical protein [Arthrobacter sp. J3.49]
MCWHPKLQQEKKNYVFRAGTLRGKSPCEGFRGMQFGA